MATKPAKSHKTTKKTDDTADENITSAPAPQLHDISARRLVGYPSPTDTTDASSKPDVTPAQPAKRVVLRPLSDTADAEKQPDAPSKQDSAAATFSDISAPQVPDSRAAGKSPRSDGEGINDAEAAKLEKDTQKAAEETAKRDRELQDYIDSHQYFVPIDAVARKRSTYRSILLTLLVLLLAIVLVDLMIDSGIILLVQKIPHTHFFTLNS